MEEQLLAMRQRFIWINIKVGCAVHVHTSHSGRESSSILRRTAPSVMPRMTGMYTHYYSECKREICSKVIMMRVSSIPMFRPRGRM